MGNFHVNLGFLWLSWEFKHIPQLPPSVPLLPQFPVILACLTSYLLLQSSKIVNVCLDFIFLSTKEKVQVHLEYTMQSFLFLKIRLSLVFVFLYWSPMPSFWVRNFFPIICSVFVGIASIRVCLKSFISYQSPNPISLLIKYLLRILGLTGRGGSCL